MSDQTLSEKDIRTRVERASDYLQKSWPLYSFVTSNPLSGLEDQSFSSAIEQARGLFGSGGYPTAYQFRQAMDQGAIDTDRLRDLLRERGYEQSPEQLITFIKHQEKQKEQRESLKPTDRRLNQILEKWLSVFLDEGRSQWSMPGRENGFYRAWRVLAPLDHHVDEAINLNDLPTNKVDVIKSILREIPEENWHQVLTFHLTELPGWVGYIKQRTSRSDDWAQTYPIDLLDYLAVRFALARQLEATIVPEPDQLEPVSEELDDIRQCFLKAWEDTYRHQLVESLHTETDRDESSSPDTARPDAQLVFCIDTRSEIIRRHIENCGAYETHGYAGFFGIPARREQRNTARTVNACPPIVTPRHRVTDGPVETTDQHPEQYERHASLFDTTKKALKKLKKNVLAAFSFVELSGAGYGLGMIGKTLFPNTTRQIKEQLSERAPDYEEVFYPRLNSSSHCDNEYELEPGLSLEKQVDYAESAFQLMGWDTFAPVVVFAGHVSETSNNPFDSSLRCGACAGNSGVPNAKMLARICNKPAVRDQLAERGIDVPEDTVFVAAKHNTTTDEITLYDDHLDTDIPDIDALKSDLEQAHQQAAAERASDMPNAQYESGTDEVKTRASDWAQIRPEWGLAGNASFIIGPNKLRRDVDLEGRAFLHSYDWSQDPDGSALEQIIAGPLVVCQWINHQYYFSTVDPALYGSGSKITHNPVGNFGVLQGNGGDLMGGLPLQSLKSSDHDLQHEPIRLQNIIYAPYSRVEEIVRSNETVRTLIENNWIDLTVIDPQQENDVIQLDLDQKESVSETEAQQVDVR